MAKATGIVTIELDGETLESETGATISIGGVTREALITETGNVYAMTTQVPATIECSVMHLTGTDLTTLANIEDGVLNFKCDTGQVYTITNAFLTEPPSLSGGKVPLKWAGKAAVKQ